MAWHSSGSQQQVLLNTAWERLLGVAFQYLSMGVEYWCERVSPSALLLVVMYHICTQKVCANRTFLGVAGVPQGTPEKQAPHCGQSLSQKPMKCCVSHNAPHPVSRPEAASETSQVSPHVHALSFHQFP